MRTRPSLFACLCLHIFIAGLAFAGPFTVDDVVAPPPAASTQTANDPLNIPGLGNLPARDPLNIPGIGNLPAGAPALATGTPRYTLYQAFKALNNYEAETITQVRHIWKNDDAWYARWKMVTDAKKTIDCTYYIVDKDIFGQAFLGLLIKKAREGVKIRLMIDGRIYRSPYMKGQHDRVQELAAFSNVEVRLFNSVLKSLFGALTNIKGLFASNHDKIIIADDQLSIIGGRNIGADYYVGKGEYSIVYRDADILMEGARIARSLKQAFDDEWNSKKNSVVKADRINLKKQLDRLEIAYHVMNGYVRGWGLLNPDRMSWTADQKELLKEFNKEVGGYKNLSSFNTYRHFTTAGPKRVKILDKHSQLGKQDGITPALIALIGGCREEIIIQNPYVVLTDEAWQALKKASARGVKIIFHSNSGASTDSLFPQAFLMNDWQKMLKDMPTCRIFVAPSINERLHSKTFVFDRKVTVIGSYNMDPLSQDSNSEVVAAVYDLAFAQETAGQIQKDMTKVLEYKIRIEKDGKITRVFGPEDHLDAKMIRRMNFYRRLKFIRPVI